MVVTIRRKDILNKGACDYGLALFDRFCAEMEQGPDLTIEWDPLSMLWALSSANKYQARWAIENKVLPSWSLAREDLRNADLGDADICCANLYGADLRGAILRNTSLGNADLRNADLTGAHLREAYLAGADLRNADLRNADLSFAILSNANLSGANLTEANLDGAYHPIGPLPDGWRRTVTGHLTKS